MIFIRSAVQFMAQKAHIKLHAKKLYQGYTQYGYKWDSLNGTLDKIWHGTWDNVYWVTKN